jgi:hypothetical protein
LSEAHSALRQMLDQRDRAYMLGTTRTRMRSSLENLDVGDFHIDKLSEGGTVELPRWVAEELVSLKLAEVDEEPFDVQVLRALSKEKLMGPMQLSPLQEDFYIRMRRRLAYLAKAVQEGRARKEDVDRLRAACYDIVGMRLNKLLSLSGSSVSASTLADRLTPDEASFFATSQSMSKEWKTALLGGAG